MRFLSFVIPCSGIYRRFLLADKLWCVFWRSAVLAMVLRGFSFRVTSFLFLSDIPVLYLRLRWGFVGLSRRDLFTLVASGDISPSRVSPDFSGTCRLFCRNKGALFCHCRVWLFTLTFCVLDIRFLGCQLFPFISGFLRSAPFCEVFIEPSRRSGLCLLSLTFASGTF
jgi:hypothetical protein